MTILTALSSLSPICAFARKENGRVAFVNATEVFGITCCLVGQPNLISATSGHFKVARLICAFVHVKSCVHAFVLVSRVHQHNSDVRSLSC